MGDSVLNNRPALKFCIPLVLGILIGWVIEIPIFITIGLLTLLLVILVLKRFRSFVDSYKQFILLAVIFLFGIIKITYDSKIVPTDNVGFYASTVEKNVTLKAAITDLPIKKGRHYSFVVDADSFYCGSYNAGVEGSVQVNLYQDSLPISVLNSLSYGKRVSLSGSIIQLPPQRNPYEFDYRKYLLLNGVYARLNLQNDSDIVVENGQQNVLMATFVYPVRAWINKVLEKQFKGEEEKLMKGLVLGERQEMSPDIKTAFINSGLMHILAVSGFNVGLVVLILYAGLSFFRLPMLGMVIIASLCLIYFGLLTGAQASVMRAVIMAIIFLSAKLFQRKADLLNILAVAAIVLLLIDSRALFDVGFQLSFMAVAGLAYFYPKIDTFIKRFPSFLTSNILLRYLLVSIAVSVAATLGTLPLSAYYFQKVSIAGLGMNVIAVPLSGIILGMGFASVAVSTVSLWLGSIYALPANILSIFLLRITTWSGYSAYAFIETHITIFDVFFWYFLIFLLFQIKKGKALSGIIIIALLWGNSYLYADIIKNASRPFRVTFLDVGQGDSIFLEFPDGKNALIDTGPYSPGNDAGARFIVPYLQHQGIHEIDNLVVTHPHSDHLGGAPFILRNVKVDRVIDAGARSNSYLCRDLYHIIDSLHIDHRIITAGSTIEISPESRIYVLHPSGIYTPSDSIKNIGFNNQSLVLKISYGTTSVLLGGDAQGEAEQRMGNIYGDFLNAQILKIGHHGSKTSSSPDYLASVHPQFAVMEIGHNNKFDFPHPVTIEKLRLLSCQYFRTDEDGAVMMESDGDSWHVINWRDTGVKY
ncbi:MAG: DNA internalization-related competence protein ComEC/Rec2 [Bacteroidota bacterium]